MRIIFIGDVVGKAGRIAVAEALSHWRDAYQPDVVIANAENSAGGQGATPKTLSELQAAGVDCFTMGDHVFDQPFSALESFPIVRPANLIEPISGSGTLEFTAPSGETITVINLLGYAFLKRRATSYFSAADRILETVSTKHILVDFHAEATSEKLAFGHYLDGRVSAVVGTHTHVPTADTRILPGKTAFQADVGMCGALESVLGFSTPNSHAWLRREMGEQIKPSGDLIAKERPFFADAVFIETDSDGRASSIERLTTRP